jgi:cytochrome P450
MDAGIVHERATVFGSLLESDMPQHEKSLVRLTDEASAVLGAGTETTSWTLSVITYHLLTQPDTLARLTKELQTVVDDPKSLPQWTALEKLPYLGAVIFEGLRLSYGVSARTSRVPTEESLFYRGEWTPKGRKAPVGVEYVIPQGYAIGMSSVITHHDESVFPDSHSFIPDRWLDDNMQRRKELERCMLSFSKGSRACLGMK